jgi:hypothetical protein
VKGELVPHESGVELEVLDADPRRIKRLRVHRSLAGSHQPGGNGKSPGESEPGAKVEPLQGRTGEGRPSA